MRKHLQFLSLFLAVGALASCGQEPLPYTPPAEGEATITKPFVDYSVPVTSLTIPTDERTLTLVKGEEHTYNLSIEPKKANASVLIWSSDNEEVVSVNAGTVSALSVGSANITVTSKPESFVPIVLRVNVIIPLTDFSLGDALTIGYNKTHQINPTYSPADTSEKDLITYKCDKPSIASVSETGLITTGSADGQCVVTAKYTKGETTIVRTLNVNVSEKHVTGISLDKSVNKVEIGKSITMHATLSPADAYETYYTYSVSDKNIASISDTGVLTGLAKGTVTVSVASVYKPEVNKDSFSVEVYQVYADSMVLPDSIALSNVNSTYQIDPLYVDNSGEPITPSKTNVSYEIVGGSDDCIELSETGKVSFKANGSATIRVTDNEIIAHPTKDIPVTCSTTAKTVTITGDKKVIIGESVILTIVSDPIRTSLTDSSISIETTSGREYVDVDESLLDSNNTIEVTGLSAGTVSIVATVGGVKSATFSLQVANKEFEAGHAYVVGNRNYSSGSAVNGDSWHNAGQAYDMTSIGGEGLKEQFEAHKIYLTADSLWKIRVGKDTWLDFDTDGGEYEASSPVFEKNQMEIDHAEGGTNMKVLTSGYYNIYYKLYGPSELNPNDYWKVYVCETPTLSLSSESVQVKKANTVEVEAHDYVGSLTFTPADSSIATAAMGEGNRVVVTGVAKGTTTITVEDEAGYSKELTVSVFNRLFENNKVYICGDHDYSTGTSGLSGDFWNDADRAYLMEAYTGDGYPDHVVDKTFRSEITFQEGDTWKARLGNSWRSKELWVDGGDAGWYQVGKYCIDQGAFASKDMEFNSSENVVVNTAGTYYVDYVFYNNEHPEGWYEVHVTKVPSLELSEADVAIDLSGTNPVTVTASNVSGTLEAESQNTSVVTVSVSGSTITLTGVASGTTTVNVHDNKTNLVIDVTVAATIDKSFHENVIYVVGDHDYHTGESISGASWDDSTKAYEIGAKSVDVDQDAFIHFNYGDQWRVRVGTGYVNEIKDYDYSGWMSKVGDNIVVNDPGWYRISYHNTIYDGDWVKISRFYVDNTDLKFWKGASADFSVYNYKPTLSVVSNNTSVATVSVDGNKVTVSGVNAGSTTITVSDGTGVELTVNITIFDKIYFVIGNSNVNWWCDANALTYLHMFNSGDGSIKTSWPGLEMTRVSPTSFVYYLEISWTDLQKYDRFIFNRVNPNNTAEVWNRTSKDGGEAIHKPEFWNVNCWRVTANGVDYDDGGYTGGWAVYSA